MSAAHGPAPRDAPVVAPIRESANRQNLLLLTQLRWIAALGQIATILVVWLVLGIPLPLLSMAAVIATLLLVNAASVWRVRSGRPVSNGELFLQLLLDVAALTIQLSLSGGADNPFVILFLLQVILGAVLLETWSAWTLVATTGAAFLGLMHQRIALAAPPDLYSQGILPFHVQGTFIGFLLAAGLLVFFVDKINRNLRLRDRRLGDLGRQAAEEEHIVRMGLLASGAAHELGTPLATLAVILNDWRRLPVFSHDPGMAQEMEDMQAQLDRCKSIVTGILLSAGEARGEHIVSTSASRFVDELVAEWRAFRSPRRLDYMNLFRPDERILSDPALKQVIASLFDNAFEASPEWMRVTVRREEERLVLDVEDAGPGFTQTMLEEFGKPYRSSKNRAGSGLGLFLVVNVVRKLGGTVEAGNRPDGGARVTLALPLERLRAEEPDGRR
ncbi:ATP-binding protein [Aureimonas sp. AU4]|uniref:ATP-binding protein n=1 Tax=Aureimonas sp. AU4 TaxID=1638163 RepID=UPI000A9650C6|nr:ATP-binding protein [Aureimonas sp. AU4]